MFVDLSLILLSFARSSRRSRYGSDAVSYQFAQVGTDLRVSTLSSSPSTKERDASRLTSRRLSTCVSSLLPQAQAFLSELDTDPQIGEYPPLVLLVSFEASRSSLLRRVSLTRPPSSLFVPLPGGLIDATSNYESCVLPFPPFLPSHRRPQLELSRTSKLTSSLSLFVRVSKQRGSRDGPEVWNAAHSRALVAQGSYPFVFPPSSSPRKLRC